MMAAPRLRGVFAAAVTPLQDDFSPDLAQIPAWLGFLAGRGCHGALILGTTGEGPSFSPDERKEIFKAAVKVREEFPDFILLGGTGTPSLQETVDLNRAAFDLGLDGVVVLPPYYYRDAGEDGLLAWFGEVIRQSIPPDGALLGYHIPSMSGVPLTRPLLQSLLDRFPGQFVGIKDSSGDPDHAVELGNAFGDRLTVFNGNDRLFSLALNAHAAGCITAPANVISPLLRRLWDARGQSSALQEIQDTIESARRILDRYPPAASILKGVLARRYHLPLWPPRPPLLPAPEEAVNSALEALEMGGFLE